jgi:26S proteasome regulatory subunit N3
LIYTERLLDSLATFLDEYADIQAGQFALETTEIISKANRRTLDQLAAKVYFYLARAYELQGKLGELQP